VSFCAPLTTSLSCTHGEAQGHGLWVLDFPQVALTKWTGVCPANLLFSLLCPSCPASMLLLPVSTFCLLKKHQSLVFLYSRHVFSENLGRPSLFPAFPLLVGSSVVGSTPPDLQVVPSSPYDPLSASDRFPFLPSRSGTVDPVGHVFSEDESSPFLSFSTFPRFVTM